MEINNNHLIKVDDADAKNGIFTIPSDVKVVEPNAFDGCSFSTINITSTIDNLQLSDINFETLSEVNVYSNQQTNDNLGEFKYFTLIDGGYKLSNYNIPNSIDLNKIKFSVSLLSECGDYSKILLKEQNNAKMCNFYNEFLLELPKNDIKQFVKSHTLVFLKQMPLSKIQYESKNTYKFLYNLGAFKKPEIYDGKTIDYGQKVSEFLLEKIRKNQLDLDKLSVRLESMSIIGFKKDFTDFFLNNFDEIIQAEEKDFGFISRCYNEFEKIQKTNTSNKGGQRQLKPTVQKFIDYFKADNKFKISDPETKKIAETIAPYYNNQRTFNDAVVIDRTRIDNNIPDNILSIPLKENSSPFNEIDKLSEKITETQVDILKNMTKTADNEFTWEWLEKNDPQNFILGKLCSCCAHLEGMGFSIMNASIINENVQNMVIRNSDNEIISKATLYVNRNEGYGIFNTIAINDDIPKSKYPEIYKKYISGIEAFAEEYNRENPDKMIKQINVGMDYNKLDEEIKNNNEESSEILETIKYSKYGIADLDHSGDSHKSQYILWKIDEKNNSKKYNSSANICENEPQNQ